MKLVLDTNVILAALFSRNGLSNKLLVWLFEQHDKFNVVSNPLVTELEDVLTRDKNLDKYINLSKEDVESFIDDICLISYKQNINFLWRPFLKDRNDDMVLEVAFNSNSNSIITYNKKDFSGVKEHFNIDVLTPKEFLIQIGELK